MRMTGRGWVALCAAVGFAVAGSGAALGAQRYEDVVGDALGDAPDVVAVEIDEPAGPVLSFSVVFATAPPLSGDETSSDILWLVLDTDPEVSFPELDGFSLMTMGSSLARDESTGSHLLAGDDLYWYVVDVDSDGPVITFRVDRKLLGDPSELWFRVYSATLEGSLYTEQTDVYPAADEAPALYVPRPVVP